jgi:glutaredoxin-like protein
VIPTSHKERLRRELESAIEGQVRVVLFTQEVECASCQEARNLAEEVASLSNKIKLEIYDFVKDMEKAKGLGIDKVPAMAVLGKKEYGIRFYGIPFGYELKPFLEALVMASSGSTKLSEESRRKLKALGQPVHIQVFVTPTCPYCPAATGLAHQCAIENTLVRSDMVEITEFPHLAQKYAVMGVPKVVINDRTEFVGALPEEHFIDQVLMANRPLQATR